MAQVETATKTDAPPATAPPKKNKGGRPPASQDRIPRVLSFFDKVAEIPKDDWGSRARIKIYRTEPSIDRVSLGKKRYVRDSLQPIDEDAIKRATWGGSGSYRLYLTYKAPTEREGKEIDSVEVDILDTEYPPRLEPGEWLDIPENAKWKWAKSLLETPPVPQPTPMSSIVEVMNATNEIRRTAIEEMRQSAAPPANPAGDPFAAAMNMAEKLLTIRADNPMVTMMSEQLAALRSELSAQRERSDRLMEKLAEKNNTPATPPADPLATMKSIFDTFKSVREQAAEVLPASEGRGHRMSFLEWAQPIGLKLADAFGPIAEAIAHNAMSPAPANGAAPQIQQRPAAQQQDFSAFLDMLTPRILHFFHDYTPEAGPAEFASWFYDGWGDQAKRAVDKIETSGGVPALMNWYRSSRHWAAIAEIEPEFTKFLTAALAWKPEGEQPQAPEDATEHEVIDLEAQEEAANAAN